MEFEHLKLNNQLCFPVYAASRLITREYQPFLNELGITYPQYLVLLVLWETDSLSVNEIADKLILNTNTLTPLLKRLESMGIVKRTRSEKDERRVIVSLTSKGTDMMLQASAIPYKLVEKLRECSLSTDKLMELKSYLNELIDFLIRKNDNSDAAMKE